MVALSDSNGYIYDLDGVKLDIVKEIKEFAAAASKSTPTLCRVRSIPRDAAVSGQFRATLRPLRHAE